MTDRVEPLPRPGVIPRAVALLCATGAFAGLATAQGTDGGALQTVEITAQKRSQNLQVVPVSVQAMTAGDLEKSGVRDLFNLADLAPSVTGGQANRTLGARMGTPASATSRATRATTPAWASTSTACTPDAASPPRRG